MTYLKIAGALLAVLLAFGGGYRYAAALYEKDAASASRSSCRYGEEAICEDG